MADDILAAYVPDRRKRNKKHQLTPEGLETRKRRMNETDSEREERLAKGRIAASERYQRKKSAQATAKTSSSRELVDLTETFMIEMDPVPENADAQDTTCTGHGQDANGTPLYVPMVDVPTKHISDWLNIHDLWFYSVSKSQTRLDEFLAVQDTMNQPVPGWHPIISKAAHFSARGTHIFVDEGNVVCSIRITPFEEVSQDILNGVALMVDYCSLVSPIKSNAAMNHAAKPCGDMCALGFHPRYEPGGGVQAYGPKEGGQTWAKLIDFHDRGHPANLATMYKDGLKSLVPAKYAELMSEARRVGAPGFERRAWSAADDELHLAGPNVLTITFNGFSNAAHRDRDKCPQAYGMWWAGSKTVTNGEVHYSHETVSHGKVRGGGFYLPEYGILVDFENAGHSLVEVFWRGCMDYHVTLGAEEPADGTRWGTSIQLTKSVADRTIKLVGAPDGRKVFTVDQYSRTYGRPPPLWGMT